MSRIFFYGLFMDANLLRERGFHPEVVGRAELPGYRIHLGKRASLVAMAESTCYGFVIDLPEKEATALYSGPDVSDYQPESVKPVLLEDRTITPALCYNLAEDKLAAEPNREYAEQLSALVMELGFPPAYASDIRNVLGAR